MVAFPHPPHASDQSSTAPAPHIWYATLDKLPETVQFPESLRDRVWFEPQTRRLAFRGFMGKATYDRLISLSGHRSYQKTIDELFLKSTAAASATSSTRAKRWLVYAVTLAILVAFMGVALWFPLRTLVGH